MCVLSSSTFLSPYGHIWLKWTKTPTEGYRWKRRWCPDGSTTCLCLSALMVPSQMCKSPGKRNMRGLIKPKETLRPCVSPSEMRSELKTSVVFPPYPTFADTVMNFVHWQWFSKVFLSTISLTESCQLVKRLIESWAFNGFCPGFSRFSFKAIMDCTWWNSQVLYKETVGLFVRRVRMPFYSQSRHYHLLPKNLFICGFFQSSFVAPSQPDALLPSNSQ